MPKGYTLVQLDADFATSYADVAVAWGSVTASSGAAWWSGANPTRLTVPSGVTRMKLMAGFDFQQAGVQLSMITTVRINNVVSEAANGWYPRGRTQIGSVGGYANHNTYFETPVFAVTPGDYIEVMVQLNPDFGGTGDVLANTRSWCCVTDETDWRGLVLSINADDTAVVAATPYTMPWTTELIDDRSAWAVGTPTEITIPAGVTAIRWTSLVRGTSSSTAGRFVAVEPKINGQTMTGGASRTRLMSEGQATNTAHEQLAFSGTGDVTPGDTLTFDVWGGTTTADILAYSWVEVEFLRETVQAAGAGAGWRSTGLPPGHTISNGGLTATNTSAGDNYNSGSVVWERRMHYYNSPRQRVYWEVVVTNRVGTNDGYVGVAPSQTVSAAVTPSPAGAASDFQVAVGWRAGGAVWSDGAQVTTTGTVPTWATGDRLMLCWDLWTGSLWTGKNGTWDENPDSDAAAYSVPAVSSVSQTWHPIVTCRDQTDAMTMEDGGADGSGFAYTVPTTAVGLGALKGV